MKRPSAAVMQRIQALARIAVDLREGRCCNITRLTLIKGLCSDPDAAARFAVHVAGLAQRRFKARTSSKTAGRHRYGQLIARAIPAMTRYLRSPTEKTESKLWAMHQRLRNAQNRVEHQRWGDVRIIECWELLIVETAMECLLHPHRASVIAYQVAGKYAQQYDPHYGTGLIPKSAPMVQEFAEFWGTYWLGRGWRKKAEK